MAYVQRALKLNRQLPDGFKFQSPEVTRVILTALVPDSFLTLNADTGDSDNSSLSLCHGLVRTSGHTDATDNGKLV